MVMVMVFYGTTTDWTSPYTVSPGVKESNHEPLLDRIIIIYIFLYRSSMLSQRETHERTQKLLRRVEIAVAGLSLPDLKTCYQIFL